MTILPTGTRVMATNEQKAVKSVQKVFSVKEICYIIQVCHKNEVSSLTLGEFSLSFEKRDRSMAVSPKRRSNLPEVVTTPLSAVNDRTKLDEDTYVSLSQKEYEAAQLLIDDPVAFENAEIDAALQQ